MIEVVGWLAYILIISAFGTNALKYPKTALSLWIFGDILWIVYNIAIQNYPHMAMNITVIAINAFGLNNYFKETDTTNE